MGKYSCTKMFIAMLFIIIMKKRKPPKCPYTGVAGKIVATSKDEILCMYKNECNLRVFRDIGTY